MIDADLQLGPPDAAAQPPRALSRHRLEHRPGRAEVRELVAGFLVDDALPRAAALDAEPAPHANIDANRRSPGRVAGRVAEPEVDAIRAGCRAVVRFCARVRRLVCAGNACDEKQTDCERPHLIGLARRQRYGPPFLGLGSRPALASASRSTNSIW